MDQDQQQTQTAETPTTSDAGGVSRNDLIKAVQDAGGTASVDVAAEKQAADERATAAGGTATPVEAAAEDPDEKFNALLRAREEEHKKRLGADDYAARVRQSAEAEKQRILDEAKAEARRAIEQEMAEFKARYRANPTATLRSLADNPQDIVDAVLREGTPEGRALAQAQEEVRQAREEAKAGAKAAEDVTKLREELQREKQQHAYVTSRDRFLSTHATKESAPAIHAHYRTPDARFEELDRVCRDWEARGLQRGVDFDDAQLVRHVEKQSREWLRENGFTLATTPAQQVSAGAPAKEPGNAPKVPANGTRTLSAAQGSERRTSPRPLSEMKPEEARQALIDEVAAARRANPDSPF